MIKKAVMVATLGTIAGLSMNMGQASAAETGASQVNQTISQSGLLEKVSSTRKRRKFRRHFKHFTYGYYPYYAYGYGYKGCYWLKRKFKITGRYYWLRRYERCLWKYDH